MEKIKKFEDAYYGKEKQTYRIMFNVPLPVLSGMVDSLKDAFDDEIAMRYGSDHPADRLKMAKFQALFDREASSLRDNARWDYKTRADKFLAILSGRGIQKTFAQSDPHFMLNFEVVDYHYFHCEPRGGGLLGRHLFKGEEGIFKTKKQLLDGAESGLYNREAVTQIIAAGAGKDYKTETDAFFQEKFSRFEAMGMDVQGHNYVGDQVHNLCEWYPIVDGKKWYLLFDPWTHQAARIDECKAVFESGLDPYTSWATHEDPHLFWTKGYCDDFFVAHDTIRALLSQELTNRQKKNMTPKFFDAEMVDASRLDKAQYEHDALVPVKTFGGTRKLSDSLYQFDVKELGTATIDLADWLSAEFKTWTGTQEITDQANAKVAANVVYSKLQSASKRLSHRAKSFQEAYAEAGLRAWHGFAEHLSGSVVVQVLGPKGYGWDYITHEDSRLEGQVDPKVVSKSEEDEMNVMGKEQKKKWLDWATSNPDILKQYNPKFLAEIGARDIAGLKDDDVAAALDVNEFQARSIQDKADVAILKLAKGKMPDLVYDADTGFMERIMQFERDHRNELAKKLPTNPQGEILMFYEYLIKHAPIVASNMGKIANQILMQRKVAQSGQPQEPGVGGAPGPGPTPAPAGAPAAPQAPGAAPQLQMSDMGMSGGLQNGAA